MLTVALTKGRIEEPVVALLEKAGYGMANVRNKKRELIFSDEHEDVRYCLVKAADSVTYINQGAVDVAFVGSDVIAESDRTFYEVLDLNVGRCDFVLAAPKGVDLFARDGHLKIGTKYPEFTKNYFQEKGYDVEIIKIEGSVELSPLIGVVDGIIDIMETGNTLRQNGLVVVDKIKPVSTRMIVNTASFRTKSRAIAALIERLGGAVND
ncbi:ATP phosphoribosyltransferase [Aerococcaceae bacterium DSM 111022]|nr:ATP phosphoribosyltransferase [Aerococcaceae bacterium DSM 111022]